MPFNLYGWHRCPTCNARLPEPDAFGQRKACPRCDGTGNLPGFTRRALGARTHHDTDPGCGPKAFAYVLGAGVAVALYAARRAAGVA